MKVLVTEMPKTPKDCLFSELDIRGGTYFYVCTLREYLGLNEEEEDAWVSIGEDALYELLEKQRQ